MFIIRYILIYIIVNSEPANFTSLELPSRRLRSINQGVMQQCGLRQNEEFIDTSFKAQKINFYDWPWIGAIFVKTDHVLSFRCGSVLVTSNIVLTAAHCVHGLRDSDIVLYFGRHNLLGWGEFDDSQVRTVSNVIIHNKYVKDGRFYDIAVIVLRTHVQFNMKVQPICLLSQNETETKVGTLVTLVGWGQNENGHFSSEPMLINMPTDKCSNQFPRRPEWDETNFCAGFNNGTGPCLGDSGSALVKQGNDGRWILQGIQSGSLKHDTYLCDTNRNTIITDMTKFTAWVQDKVEMYTKSSLLMEKNVDTWGNKSAFECSAIVPRIREECDNKLRLIENNCKHVAQELAICNTNYEAKDQELKQLVENSTLWNSSHHKEITACHSNLQNCTARKNKCERENIACEEKSLEDDSNLSELRTKVTSQEKQLRELRNRLRRHEQTIELLRSEKELKSEQLSNEKEKIQTWRESLINGRVAFKRYFENEEYLVHIRPRLSWREAKKVCLALGYRGLAKILNSRVNSELGTFCNQKNDEINTDYPGAGCFIDGTDEGNEGTFTWSENGARLQYLPWRQGEPNNQGDGGAENCIEITFQNNQWNDSHCVNRRLAFICMK